MLGDGEKGRSETWDMEDIVEADMLVVDYNIYASNALDPEGMTIGKKDCLVARKERVSRKGSLVWKHVLGGTGVEDDHEDTRG